MKLIFQQCTVHSIIIQIKVKKFQIQISCPYNFNILTQIDKKLYLMQSIYQ